MEKDFLKHNIWSKIIVTMILSFVIVLILHPSVNIYAASEIEINDINFPDDVFREYVTTFDKDTNGILSYEERNQYYFEINDKGISNLKGIEYFTKLRSLVCYNNNISELNLKSNTNLKVFYGWGNKFTSVNVELINYENLIFDDTVLNTTQNIMIDRTDGVIYYGNEINSIPKSHVATKSPLFYGDNNHNGEIEGGDISRLYKYINGILECKEVDILYGDVDGNGILAQNDTDLLYDYMRSDYDKTIFPVYSLLDYIKIQKIPTKLEYFQEEKIDYNDILVVAYYKSGSSKSISDFSIEGGTDKIGSVTVTVKYSEAGVVRADSYIINVKPIELKSQTIKNVSNITKEYSKKSFVLKAVTNGDGKISYTSSNKKVATVSADGKVKLLGAGKTKITVKASGTSTYKSAEKSIILTVKAGKQKITSKVKSKTMEYTNKPFSLGTKVLGNAKVIYKSSNPKVLKVSSKGKVTLTGIGKATITIKTKKTSKFASSTKKINITVTAPKIKLRSKALSGKKVALSWTASQVYDGYYVEIAYDRQFKDIVRNGVGYFSKGKSTAVISGFQAPAGTKYFVRMRPYCDEKSRDKLYAWSNVTSFTTID